MKRLLLAGLLAAGLAASPVAQAGEIGRPDPICICPYDGCWCVP